MITARSGRDTAVGIMTGTSPRHREVLGAAEGMKEDKASWVSFFQ